MAINLRYIRPFQRGDICLFMLKDSKTVDNQIVKAASFLILCSDLLLIDSLVFDQDEQFFQLFGLQRLIVPLWKGLIHTSRHAKAKGCARWFWVL